MMEQGVGGAIEQGVGGAIEQGVGGAIDAERDGRVDTIGWGVLLVAVGLVGLIPGRPDGAWLVVAGAVMLGACVVRAWLGLSVHGLTLILGALATAGGLGSLAGLAGAIGPLVLIVGGLVLMAKAVRQGRRGRAGAWPPLGEGGLR